MPQNESIEINNSSKKSPKSILIKRIEKAHHLILIFAFVILFIEIIKPYISIFLSPEISTKFNIFCAALCLYIIYKIKKYNKQLLKELEILNKN